MSFLLFKGAVTFHQSIFAKAGDCKWTIGKIIIGPYSFVSFTPFPTFSTHIIPPAYSYKVKRFNATMNQAFVSSILYLAIGSATTS